MSRSAAHDARNEAFRSGLGSPDARKEARIPTADVVPAECQRLGIQVKAEEVPDSDGAVIHWIGDSSLENVMLYFHGGGFGMPPYPGHVNFLVQTQQKLASEGKQVAVAFIEYSLTPQHKFPTQHMQTVQALKYILHMGRKPSNVIVGGDSAGGNLALGIISASLHSHAGIPDLKLESPLRGALLISPWSSFSSDSNSYAENIDKDIVTKEIMVSLRDDFLTSLGKDEFAEPSQADAAWWANAPVDSILNLGGAYEIFWDYIEDLGVKMKEAKLNVQTVECEKQVHIDCILDAQAELETGPMSLAIWDWLRKIL